MASVPWRNKEASKFLPTKPRFFKIIHGNNITRGKLVIPKKFIENHGNNLQSPVWLKVPTGAVWKMELRKCGTEVWLQEGWQEFAKYYSLTFGNLLVFEYEGNCDFSLLIFDKTATEIEYYHKNDEFNQFNTENSDSVVILDGMPSGQIKREKPPLVCSQPGKIRRTKSPSSADSASKLPQAVLPNGSVSLENAERDIKPHCCTSQPQEVDSFSCIKGEKKSLRAQRMAERERVKALQGACGFKPKNPFFKVVMQKSHVQTTYSLTVAESFAAKHFCERRGDVNLCVSDGRTWPAKYYTTICGPRMQTKVFHGWREFAKDMHLEVGDVCVFELTDATKISINVTIFRHTDLRELSQSALGDGPVVQEPLQLSIHQDTSAYPSFKVAIQLYNLERCTVNVPARITRAIAKDNRQTAILRAADNIPWLADLHSYASEGILSGAGWRAFARTNALHVGDICTFELINSSKPEFKVSFSRKNVN